MSTLSGGPNITTNGLILYFDALNNKSYVSGSTIWTNMVQTNNVGVITNGPTFNSNNSLLFDGIDDYVDFSVTGLSTIATIETWVKLGSGAFTEKMIFGWNDYDVYLTAAGLGFNTLNADVYGISITTANNLGLVNNWKHYIFEMRTDVSYSNNKIFINGVQQSLSQISGTENAGFRTFGTGIGRISGFRRTNGFYHIPMNCGVFKVYNRSLTNDEINRLYNSTKNRFGL